MVRKKVFVLTLFVFVLIFGMLNFFSVYYLDTPLSPVALTGQVVENGIVKLYVEGGPKIITIDSPLNVSYDYDIGDAPYILDLNVSADFFVDDWNYSLYDMKHGNETATELEFTPNITITATRWGNRLTVGAHKIDGDWYSEEVVFNIEVPNSEPVFGAIPNEIFACEGERYDYRFTAADADEEVLIGSITPKHPNVPFLVKYLGMTGLNTSRFKIYSGPLVLSLLKEEDGFISKTYAENISVLDAVTSNTVSVDITVIEVNNAVKLLKNLGAQTVYLNGSDSNFSYQMDVFDAEDGTAAEGNMIFNLTGEDGYFIINSSTGVINYTPTYPDHNGTRLDLTVCVSDSALASSHVNFSVCANEGYFNESTSVCDDFSLTVTDDNRAPVIDSYSPLDTNFTVRGTATTVFNVSVSDADGTIPDIDWYVDGVLKEENENKSSDSYSYAFACGVRGEHNVGVVVSDGLASDSQSWNVIVSVVACPRNDLSGGGGGGGGGAVLGGLCTETWACGDWDVCQNVERSFTARSLSPEDYYFTKDLCLQSQFDERFCGLQLAECVDVSVCNNSEFRVPKPTETRVCYFTEDPSCADGITNCHDGGCELLVDCGGPCPTCPTCSDGKQNQGEGDVDCGGPCPYRCDAEKPLGTISYAIIGLGVVLIGAVLFIGIKLFGIWKYGGFLKRKKKR